MSLYADDLTAFADATRVDLGLKQFWLTLVEGRIRLNLILVNEDRRGRGLGSQAMVRLCAFSDAQGAPIVLTPAERSQTLGTTSAGRLWGFYERFGFVSNLGAQRDWTICETMLRPPTPSEA